MVKRKPRRTSASTTGTFVFAAFIFTCIFVLFAEDDSTYKSAAGVWALLFVIAFGVSRRAGSVTNIMELAPFSTGQQNSCLGYDDAADTLLVGTCNNELVAFDTDGTRRWTMQARGPFKQLVVHSDSCTISA